MIAVAVGELRPSKQGAAFTNRLCTRLLRAPPYVNQQELMEGKKGELHDVTTWLTTLRVTTVCLSALYSLAVLPRRPVL